MTTATMSRRGLACLFVAASIFSTSVAAQEMDRAAPAKRLTIVPCCKCLGEVHTANLSTGAAPWTAALPNSSAQAATVPSSNPAWTTMLAPTAQWISPAGNPQTPGVYAYQTQFDARNCTIPSEITISGKFLADNSAVLLVDGHTVASSQGTPNYGFLPGSLTPFSYTIPAGSAAGVHTVTVQARNSESYTGVVVQLAVTRKCSNKIEKDAGER